MMNTPTTPTAPVAHTPGPWHIGAGNGSGSIFADSGRKRLEAGGTTLYPICMMNTGYIEGEDDANARLIAAAPELLEALQGALVALQVQPRSTLGFTISTFGFTQEEATIRRDAKRAIRAAIARATGEIAR